MQLFKNLEPEKLNLVVFFFKTAFKFLRLWSVTYNYLPIQTALTSSIFKVICIIHDCQSIKLTLCIYKLNFCWQELNWDLTPSQSTFKCKFTFSVNNGFAELSIRNVNLIKVFARTISCAKQLCKPAISTGGKYLSLCNLCGGI